MITLQQAKELKHGQVLYHAVNRNSDKTPQRWRVNGKVRPRGADIQLPVKHGVYDYFDYFTMSDLRLLCLTEKEANEQETA